MEFAHSACVIPIPRSRMIDGIATLTIVATPIVSATSLRLRREPGLVAGSAWSASLTGSSGRQAPATSRRAKITQPATSGMRL
jgi:hypothetical protein